MEFDINFWENMTYLLGGIVIAGVMAAVAQIVHFRVLTTGQTKLHVHMKKDDSDGNGKQAAADNRLHAGPEVQND